MLDIRRHLTTAGLAGAGLVALVTSSPVGDAFAYDPDRLAGG